ncbi:MAG: hypothetical protein QOG45_1891, partial [Chloroflexota bacterium]|nr:hypothetical protein [Chloroflexota bacterium]
QSRVAGWVTTRGRFPAMMARMDTPRGAAGAPTVCASQGCENLLAQPTHGGPPRRYCSESCRSADRRRRSGRAGGRATTGVVPLSVVHEDGGAGLVMELRSLSARLAELAHAVDSALVEAEVDAVSARVASIEATAAEHLAARLAAEERQAGQAAEEAAEVAEEAAEVAEERAGQLAAQAAQDAASIAALTRSLRAAEDRAAALTAELTALRTLIGNPTHRSGEVASGAWSPGQKPPTRSAG